MSINEKEVQSICEDVYYPIFADFDGDKTLNDLILRVEDRGKDMVSDFVATLTHHFEAKGWDFNDVIERKEK